MLFTALITGFLGSFHCAVMCGPLASLATASGKRWTHVTFFYNTGRIISYISLGLISFLASKVIFIAGLHNYLSIFAGGLLIIGVLLYWFPVFSGTSLYVKWSGLLKKMFGVFLRSGNGASRLFLGVINGFLPCGLVYFAVVGALVAGDLTGSILYMVLFGLGTWPAMWFAPGIFRKLQGMINWNKWIPVVFAVMGIVLVFRGLNLGIPYLSPSLPSGEILPESATVCD